MENKKILDWVIVSMENQYKDLAWDIYKMDLNTYSKIWSTLNLPIIEFNRTLRRIQDDLTFRPSSSFFDLGYNSRTGY